MTGRPYNPSRVPIEQYEKLQADYATLQKSLHKNRAGFGLGGAAVGALVTFLLMHDCHGKKNITATPANTTITNNFYGCDNDKGCNNEPNSGKKQTPSYDNKSCPEGQSCFDNGLEQKLNNCLDENEELRKRPKHCPKYTPNVCPPAPKCPEMPYLRKGE